MISWQYFWTGFNDIDQEGEWIWSDGAAVTFTLWGGKQPDGGIASNCGTMVTKYPDETGKWDDGNCEAKRAYICETDL